MTGTMRAVAKVGARPGAEIIEAPIPTPGPGEVLVKVKVAAICGTDVHIYSWDQWAQSRINPPLIFGHEFCGTVVELGPGVKGAAVGDYVSVETHFTCGICRYCRTGRGHICEDVKIVGVDRDGCFAEYVTVPAENLWVWKTEVDPEIAAIQDPYGNAVHTALECDLVGKRVLITGVGPIGLAAILIAKAAGAFQVICTDVSAYRLNLACKLGADFAINVGEVDMKEAIMEATSGWGVDVILEMSGNESAINGGLACLAKGGEVSLLGIPSRRVTLDLADGVIFKGARLYGINGRKMFETWYQGQALIEKGLDLKSLITHRFDFTQMDQAMELMRTGQCGKIVIYPNGSDK
jgi:threonine 3-dehydrogenase